METCRKYLFEDNEIVSPLVEISLAPFKITDNYLEHYLCENLGSEIGNEIMNFLLETKKFISFWRNRNLNQEDVIIVSQTSSKKTILQHKLLKEEEKLRYLHGKDRYYRDLVQKEIKDAVVSIFFFEDYKKCKIYIDFIKQLNFLS